MAQNIKQCLICADCYAILKSVYDVKILIL